MERSPASEALSSCWYHMPDMQVKGPSGHPSPVFKIHRG